jgi:hypothetical protein
MQCRQCGTEIAEKALICYRCGTATTEAKYQPHALKAKRSGSRVLILVIVAALLVLLAFFLLNSGLLTTDGRPASSDVQLTSIAGVGSMDDRQVNP